MKKPSNIISAAPLMTKAAAARQVAAAKALQKQHDKNIALIKFAYSTEQQTKLEIRAALRESGLSGTPENIERIVTLRVQGDDIRRTRYVNRANQRISTLITTLRVATGRAAVSLPEGRPTHRLTAIRELAVEKCAKKMLRNGAPGGSRFTIEFASYSSQVDYRVDLYKSWDVYRGAFKGWAANIDCHDICVPTDWRLRVERKGLAELGGMMTLDASPMMAPAGIALYAAVWACQQRGYSVSAQRGFIAVRGDEHFHAESAEKAIAGVLRKCQPAKIRAPATDDLATTVDAFIAKYASIRTNVSIDDARDSGSCEYGIQSWCETVGIDPDDYEVPMTTFLDAFRKMPLTEARRAVLFAVRRSRAEKRLRAARG